MAIVHSNVATGYQGMYEKFTLADGNVLELQFDQRNVTWSRWGVGIHVSLGAGASVEPKKTFDPKLQDGNFHLHPNGNITADTWLNETTPCHGLRFEATGGAAVVEVLTENGTVRAEV